MAWRWEDGLPFHLNATVMLVVYFLKEQYDKHKHRGHWNESRTRDKVTFAADYSGDCLGPFFVAATAWAVFLLEELLK